MKADPAGADDSPPFAELMRESHLLAPHDLPEHIARNARAIGADDAVLYLADLQQQMLVPFLPSEAGGRPPSAPLGIDSTLAGRAFQQVATLSQADETGRVRGWVPVVDGTDRLGVLGVTVSDAAALDPAAPLGRHLRFLVALVAVLVVSKMSYGDTLVRLRRVAPMQLAAEIQWGLLPPLTFTSRAVAIAAALEPAYEVAGDSVDYSVDADAARFAVFDGMGHELLSGQLVGLAVAAYRNARRSGQSLVDTSALIDDAVTTVFRGDAFITGVLAELDTGSGVLSWVSAGHPPPLLLRHGRLVRSLDVEPGLPFGAGLGSLGHGTADVHVGSEHLEPADYVLLYTDGVTEARSPDGDLFGVERLTDLLVRNLAAGLPPSETMRRAVTALLQHQRGRLGDDATMLLAQWRPEHPDRQVP